MRPARANFLECSSIIGGNVGSIRRPLYCLALMGSMLLAPQSQETLRAAEIVGPTLQERSAGETRVTQGNPPLVQLSVRGDDGRPVTDKFVKWSGPIGEGALAQECHDALMVSTAVVGAFDFLAVIVPATVTGPADVEIVRHRVVVAPPQPPAPSPPVTPVPSPTPPAGADLSQQARQWLQTVPEAARHRRADVARTLREIGGSATLKTVDEMELFLGVGLAWSIGTDTPAWASFSASANAALNQLKRHGATKDQYASALLSIARGISE